MGSSLSEGQAGWLLQHFRSAVLMLDGDAAGQAATQAITRRLSPAMDVEPVHLQAGVQSDQLDPKEVNDL